MPGLGGPGQVVAALTHRSTTPVETNVAAWAIRLDTNFEDQPRPGDAEVLGLDRPAGAGSPKIVPQAGRVVE